MERAAVIARHVCASPAASGSARCVARARARPFGGGASNSTAAPAPAWGQHRTAPHRTGVGTAPPRPPPRPAPPRPARFRRGAWRAAPSPASPHRSRLTRRSVTHTAPPPPSFPLCLRSACSFRCAVLGAAGGIGQPLSLLLKQDPLLASLHLYDIANVAGVAADVSHVDAPAVVTPFQVRQARAGGCQGAKAPRGQGARGPRGHGGARRSRQRRAGTARGQEWKRGREAQTHVGGPAAPTRGSVASIAGANRIWNQTLIRAQPAPMHAQPCCGARTPRWLTAQRLLLFPRPPCSRCLSCGPPPPAPRPHTRTPARAHTRTRPSPIAHRPSSAHSVRPPRPCRVRAPTRCPRASPAATWW